MASYVRAPEVWRCPSDTGEIFLNDPMALGRTPPFWSDKMTLTSYGYLGDGWPDDYGRIGGYRASITKRPSIGVLAFDIRPWHDRDRAGDDGYNSLAPVNVLYCDWHVGRRTRNEWGYDAIMALRK
ncbi:MAG TPA: hypothetical protein VGM37_20800 [Armatimonadota bacterium]|jgi:prepilin-type processing-associated H-X9-DG protein